MAETEQDKSEQPTLFKLQRARQKGAVARSMDLSFLVGLVVMLLYLRSTAPGFGTSVAQGMRATLIGGAGATSDANVLALVGPLFAQIARPLLLLFATLFATVLLFEVVQLGGFVFSASPLKPDFTRLNPVTGLKRLFSLKLLLETAKNVLKLAVYTAIAFLVIRSALGSRTGSVVDAGTLAEFTLALAVRLLGAFATIAFFFAIIDQLLVRRTFLRQMRMSRREVKREMRDREGDPRLKQKRKRLHGEFVKISQSVRNLPGADVVITNPEHIAVALRYDGRTMAAPRIVSIGLNGVALRMKRLAALYGITIIENRMLARALHRGGVLERPIPDDCFEPVAAIYNDLRRDGRWAEAR